jgi:hypothetical protein
MGRLDIDRYLAKRFHWEHYNCWHMLQEAWQELTGEDLGDLSPELVTKAALIGQFDIHVPRFERLDTPADPCIVLMRFATAVPHVGLYTGRRVLQIKRENGATYLPLNMATMGWPVVEFYRDRKNRNRHQPI